MGRGIRPHDEPQRDKEASLGVLRLAVSRSFELLIWAGLARYWPKRQMERICPPLVNFAQQSVSEIDSLCGASDQPFVELTYRDQTDGQARQRECDFSFRDHAHLPDHNVLIGQSGGE
jgi:hypothetical protein